MKMIVIVILSGSSLFCPEPKANFTITSHMTNPQEFSFTDTSIIPDGLEDYISGILVMGRHILDKTHQIKLIQIVKLIGPWRVTTNCGSWNETIKPAVCDCPTEAGSMLNKALFQRNSGSSMTQPHSVLSQNYMGVWRWHHLQRSAPTHRYATCGQYTARLKVTTDCGSSLPPSWTLPVAAHRQNPTLIIPVLVRQKSATDLSRATKGNVTDWQWNFGDGTTLPCQIRSMIMANPDHTLSGLTSLQTVVLQQNGQSRLPFPVVRCRFQDSAIPVTRMGRQWTFDTTKTSGDSISDLLWEFGEGNSSTLQNPRHTYSGSGTWAVNLTATSSCGAKNTYQEKITTPCFCSPPLANFSTEILSSEPFTIRVRDTSLNPETIINWNWSFGDGTYSTGQNPPDHIYAAGCGEYLISLTVTNDCGTRDTFDKLICCPVYANFTYRMEPADGTAPLTVYFTDRTIGTPQSYGWTFGDGGFSSFKNPVHTYKTGGNYSATLHATSPCGGNETHSERINVYCPPVEALFNYTIVNEDPLIIQFTISPLEMTSLTGTGILEMVPCQKSSIQNTHITSVMITM